MISFHVTTYTKEPAVSVKQADEALQRVMDALGTYEKMSPADMEKSAEFWTTALGSEFGWAVTGDLRRVTSCKHVDFYNPTFFIGHLHKKNHIDCPVCGVRRQIRNMKDNPDRCDQCGQQGFDSFGIFSVQAGMFIILGAICDGCRETHSEVLSSQFELSEDSVVAPKQGEEETQNESQDS
jgi:predicted RNA-binding Zn-ribbon protein involved in translation (DUF1610 family)